jgi:hypothetical protein
MGGDLNNIILRYAPTINLVYIGHVLRVEHEPLSILDSLKLDLSSDLFAAPYQQNAVPSGGAMIKRAWIVKEGQPPIYINRAPDKVTRFYIKILKLGSRGLCRSLLFDPFEPVAEANT